MQTEGGIRVRTYGDAGPLVLVLHGGPAGIGDARGMALGLADAFRVLEPWQRGSGAEPLTVAQHVADLYKVIRSRCSSEKTALVGHSWGAMLALAYAAVHPDSVGPLVLVGCGTFDAESRIRMKATRDERMTDDLQRQMDRLSEEITDPGEVLVRKYELCERIDHYDPLPSGEPDLELPPFDMRAHTEIWQDMIRLQEEGVYPSAFSLIRTPVIMLHGAYDPHPGQMIYSNLKQYIPQIEYHEWERCGHSPWNEKHIRDDFFSVLRQWLTQQFSIRE